MRFSVLAIAVSFGLIAVAEPRLAAAQDQRDFVFTDVEGHLVLRFAGTGAGGLDRDHLEEVVNVSLSTMVHDRLRADAVFEAEPIDSLWADAIASSLRAHLDEAGPELAAIDVQCRSSSCRLLLEHAERRSLSEHQSLLGAFQLVLQRFIEANPASFDPAFLIAAYEQEHAIPHMKAFLRRAVSPGREDRG